MDDAAFSPDGSRLATYSSNDTVRLWDVQSGSLLNNYHGGKSKIENTLATSMDGGHVAIVPFNDPVSVWNVDKGRLIELGTKEVMNDTLSVTFSPNGRRVVTGTMDGKVRLWDVDSGKPVAIFTGHLGAVRGVAFSPDGHRIATASDDGTVRLWDAFTVTQSLVDEIKQMAPRCLTSAQRDELHLGPTSPTWCVNQHTWPHDAASTLVRARASNKTSDFDEAVRVARSPQGDPLILVLALLDRAKHYKSARRGSAATAATADLEEAQRLAQGTPLIGRKIALDIAQRGENIDKGFAFFDEAVRIGRLLDDNQWDLGLALLGRARAYEKAGNKSAAAVDFEEAAHLGQNVALSFIKWGQEDLAYREYRGALESFDAAVRRAQVQDGDRWILGLALLGRAQAYKGIGDQDAATADFEQAARYGQDVGLGFVAHGADELAKEKYDNALTFFAEAVRLARPSAKYGWTMGIALLGRAQAYEGIGDQSAAAADFEEAARLGQNVPWLFIKQGNEKFQDMKYEDFLEAFDAATRWAERLHSPEETRASSLFGRGRAKNALGQFSQAVRDFDQAAQLGYPNADSWLWWSTKRLADQKLDQGYPVDALLASLSNYLQSTPEQPGSSTQLKSALSSAYRPIGNLYAQLATKRIESAQATECDRLASHPDDPLRVADSVEFTKIDADVAVAACTAAIAMDRSQMRFYLQRARAHTKAADSARDAGDQPLSSQHAAAAIADLNIAMAGNYPIVFSNMANAYYEGRGVGQDREKAGEFYLKTFNRIVACCSVRVTQHLMEVEDQYDVPLVRRVVHELLIWAAELGDPKAHEMLANLYATAKLEPTGALHEPPVAVYVHLKLAARLFDASGQEEDARRMQEQASHVVLTGDQETKADTWLGNWNTATFDSSPSWLVSKDETH